VKGKTDFIKWVFYAKIILKAKLVLIIYFKQALNLSTDEKVNAEYFKEAA